MCMYIVTKKSRNTVTIKHPFTRQVHVIYRQVIVLCMYIINKDSMCTVISEGIVYIHNLLFFKGI